jgi:RNA polymerase sigma factor (sigma-70 family)
LARWAAKGSQPAFAVIFERHHQALSRYCHSIVGNSHDAADALQNTMLKALRALPGETRTITLKPWLYRIAHNESISLMRARRDHSDLDTAAQLGDPAAHTIAESREQLRDLTADLRELTEQQRGTLLMRELAGLEFDDISAALQISATAAKQSVYEARRALQSLGEGRAMHCDLVRRTLSDGDRRTLRNMKIRGHLRDCAGCRDFQTALRHRPAHLAALTPPLPLAAAAAILQGLLGTGTGAAGSGGGLLAGLGLGGASLTGKVATVAIIASTIGGGAAVMVPVLDAPAPDRAAARSASGAARATVAQLAVVPRLSRAYATTLQGEAAIAREANGDKPAEATDGSDRGIGDRASGSSAHSAPEAAAERRAANPGAAAASRPSRPQGVGAAPSLRRDAQRPGDDARVGDSIPAPAQQASQPPVADTPAASRVPTPTPTPIVAQPASHASASATPAAAPG